MTEILMSGYGMNTLLRVRDFLIFIGEMRDTFKINGGMRDENQKKKTNGRKVKNCNFNWASSR